MTDSTNLGTTVKVAGGLLPTQLLDRVASGDATLIGNRPADYHADSATELNQQINRAWTALTGRWTAFRAALATLVEADRGTTLTRDRWLLPLFQELGYGRLQAERAAIVADGRPFAISHRWGHVPIHLVGARLALDKRVPGERGAAASPPHGLVQDLLNHAEAHRWGILSNGLELRLLRDHQSLTRQAYVSFDLEAMFDGEQFSAFRLLYLLCHQSRVEHDDPRQCWLERWVNLAQEDGVRALDRLRGGVEQALVALGGGFLKHRANEALRARLSTGALSTQDYYRELLKLVYRLLFLFVAEDRDLLLVPDAPEAAKDRYRRLYATRRLRELAVRRRGGPHDDGWQALRVVMRQLDRGNPDLALPGLGSFLWRTELHGGERVSVAIPDLDAATIANEDLYAALAALCVVQDGPVRRPVDWAGVQSDELGSVYESLMEKVPRLNVAAGTFALADAAGNERKTTGSYYTPSSLVDCLLDTALDPVLEEAAKQPDPERAILELAVVDPACGSGHFLVAAARRIAHRLARVRSGGIEPSPPEVQHALRDVVGRCIHGVDLNPMAVELCKVSLWMEAIEPGRPLSYLDGHIRHGNALLGATPELLEKGIPDEAWTPIEGDDKEVAKRLKKAHKSKQEALFGPGTAVSPGALATLAAEVEDRDDATRDAVEAKEAAQKALEAASDGAWRVADLWCAAFVWPKQAGEAEQAAPVRRLWEAVKADPARMPDATRRIGAELARRYRFFHWHLAFPRVFARGGFDVVLGNPPWDQVQLDAREWFAVRAPEVAGARHHSARTKAMSRMAEDNPGLFAEYRAALRFNQGTQHFIHAAGRFPRASNGRLNTAPLFAEASTLITSTRGMSGLVVPTGITTDSFTREFFRHLVESGRLHKLLGFENEEFIFPAVHHSTKFCILVTGGATRTSTSVSCVFFARRIADVFNADRIVLLRREDFALFNPNTGTSPTFRTNRDATVNRRMYERAGVLMRDGPPPQDPWGFRGLLMFMMNTDSGLFRTRQELEAAGWTLRGNRFERDGAVMLPLVEAKMVHHFDHRFGTYEGQSAGQANQGKLPELDADAHADPFRLTLPDYWVDATEVDQRCAGKWARGWFLGWRDICRSTDQRTVIASLIPRAGSGDTFLLAMPDHDPRRVAALYANLCSFALDYAARQKVGGTHLKFHVLKQLPILAPETGAAQCVWSPEFTVASWLLPRVLELTFTAWDLEPFARDVGHDGPPFRWDPARRFLLRAELDAAFFHLYGLSRDDTDYILDTFPIVRKNDEKTHGEYRTKRVILEIYDAMAEAIRTGVPYPTRLDPPPADPRVAHPPRVR